MELDNNSDDEFNPRGGGGDQPDQELDQSHLGEVEGGVHNVVSESGILLNLFGT